MWPNWVSNPGPQTYESGALQTATTTMYVLFAIPVISKKNSGLPDEKLKPVKIGLSE